MTTNYIGFIYEWTNTITGKKYLGSHRGKIDDRYTGSGKAFLLAVKKYGIQSFTREIIEYINDEHQILPREQYYLDLFECASNKNYYNISPSAGGGDCGNGAAISAAKKGKPAWKKGTPMSEEQIEKLCDEWIVRTPLGEEITITNMLEFCRLNDLNPSTMSAVARGDRRHYKGYWCRKLTNNRKVEYQLKEWKSKGHSGKINKGKKNGFSKRIKVFDIWYDCMREAVEATGKSMYFLRKIGEFG